MRVSALQASACCCFYVDEATLAQHILLSCMGAQEMGTSVWWLATGKTLSPRNVGRLSSIVLFVQRRFHEARVLPIFAQKYSALMFTGVGQCAWRWRT